MSGSDLSDKEPTWVLSKWGRGGEYLHPVLVHPLRYADSYGQGGFQGRLARIVGKVREALSR